MHVTRIVGWNFYASEYTPRSPVNASLLAAGGVPIVHKAACASTRSPAGAARDGGVASPPPRLCGNMLNVLLLREPRSRLISHLRYGTPRDAV